MYKTYYIYIICFALGERRDHVAVTEKQEIQDRGDVHGLEAETVVVGIEKNHIGRRKVTKVIENNDTISVYYRRCKKREKINVANIIYY